MTHRSRSAEPLRVGYLVQDFPPEVGAGPARVTEMSHRWREKGADVTVVTGMPNRRIPGRGEGEVDPRYAGKLFLEESWEGIRTLRSWVYASKSLGFAPKIVNNASFMASGFAHAVAKGERYDVLIASAPPFFPHISGVLLAKLRGMKVVLEIRDLWPDYLVEMGVLKQGSLGQRALFALERWLLRQADRVVVVTESFKERIVEKGVRRELIDVIPNGVDVQRYGAVRDAKPLAAIEKKPGEFIAGYIGTFGKGQALAQLVQAAAILEKQDTSIRLVMVGDGPDREAIHAAIRETGVKNVTVLPPIPRDLTPEFYNACDACLVPLAPLAIFQETIPSKIFEVMACERPLVGSFKGEAARIVAASQGGLTTDPGDSQAIADAVLKLRAMPQAEREAMGARARAYVSTHFNRTTLADRYLQIMQRMTAPQGEPVTELAASAG